MAQKRKPEPSGKSAKKAASKPSPSPSPRAEKAAIKRKEEQERTRNAKERMLECLHATWGLVAPAARIAQISRETHRQWMLNDPDYAKAVENTKRDVTEELEFIAYKQAPESPPMTMFLLKCNAPDKYGEKRSLKVDHTGLDTSKLSTDEIMAMLKEMTSGEESH